ncbi:FAD-dependent oxidoreductase [Enterovirga sp.]|uniref:FAD-dependent oxidoreductase n=1 Tax=Enterovirga sp. TaxID=2026350 RepID=UPI00260D498A|nr:FAD-dependent oxidoreductase [Enterovirga sp.]MDB5591299.1 glycine oxidase [Enterovirga sp.]
MRNSDEAWARAGSQEVAVIGAGICGTWTALMLSEAGVPVALHERDGPDLMGSTSRWAGGMLAPGCESDGAEPVVIRLGRRSIDLWRRHLPETALLGSLVVSHPRDRGDLDRFARQTSGHRQVGESEIAELEPALAGRFRTGLFFPDEGHVEPRAVLPALHAELQRRGVPIRFGAAVDPAAAAGPLVDCRGLSARADLPELRGVKGETALVATDEVTLRRPVRLMHPRWPLYVVPRPGGRFLIGASTIESEDVSGVSVRSALELLTAAYTLHPAFGEARILELGTALRPAYPDHAPRIAVSGSKISVNGLYRHGFLLAPALGEVVANYVASGLRDNEVMRWS